MRRSWIGVRPPAVEGPVVTRLMVSCATRRSVKLRQKISTNVSIVRLPAVVRLVRAFVAKVLPPLRYVARRIENSLPSFAARVSPQVLAIPPPVSDV